MGRRVKETVGGLRDPETGNTVHFTPDDDVPDWAAEQIDNPDIWADGDADGDDSGEPPRAGKGSGRDAWAAYAESLGVEFDEDATRDDIIAAVDEVQE
jgi:hypothetical protein